MKNIIQRVMKACNPTSPQASANMCKFQNGNLVAYGGTFCVQVPVPVDLDCAFKPQTLLAFYRKERDGASFTVKAGKMRVKHKRETVTIKCLPSEEMSIIDVLRNPTPTKWLPVGALKSLLECVDPAYHVASMQGVCLRDGKLVGTDGKVMLAIPIDIKSVSCVLPVDTIKFLASCDEHVTGWSFDGANFKLWFEGGMTVCTRVISSDEFPDIEKVMGQKSKAFCISEKVVDDLKNLKCDMIELTPKGVRYIADDESIGAIRAPVEGDYRFAVSKKNFDTIFKINKGVKFFTNDSGSIIIGNGGKRFQSACGVMSGDAFTKYGA